MYDVKTRTRRRSVSAFSLCLLASRVERKCLLGASLPVVAYILYHITVMNDQNRNEEGRNGSTL